MKCHLSSNEKDFPDASAVVFHVADLDKSHPKTFLDIKRNLEIPYIVWSLESPQNRPLLPSSNYENYFNWTMTYTRDADIWYPYGHFRKRKKQIKVDYESIWKRKMAKRRVAIWIGSNCQTANHRYELILDLRATGIKLDIFGKCGRPAPKRNLDEFVRGYMFYLAIENSFCEDYISEKFFSATMREIIPIVAQRSIYEKMKIPASAYIAVDDFKNLTEMSDHLIGLSNNKADYLKHFEWMEGYEIASHPGFCALCERLVEGNVKEKVLEDALNWQGSCNETYLDSFLSPNISLAR